MKGWDGVHLPHGFWNEVWRAGRRLLLLDYDGTLVPFRTDREKARPSPEVTAVLSGLAAAPGEEVAVLSGRPLEDLVRFLGQLPIHLIAEHGWGVRRSDGETIQHPLPPEAADALRQAEEAAEAAGLGHLLERKRTSLVLHTRGFPARRAQEMERAGRRHWALSAAAPALALVPMNGGLELRAAARNKGTAVRELLEQAGPGALAVYLGDDFTDEDAFREVRPRGYGIRVGGDRRSSLASGRIESCEAVPEFLKDWQAALNSGTGREV